MCLHVLSAEVMESSCILCFFFALSFSAKHKYITRQPIIFNLIQKSVNITNANM